MDKRVVVDDVVVKIVGEFLGLGCAVSRDGRYTTHTVNKSARNKRVNGTFVIR